MVTLAVLVLVCVGLVVLGFVAPRLSRRPQSSLDRGIDRVDEKAREHGGVSGKLGDRSSRTSRKAVDTATDAGRHAREKLE
jgi:hypothetical protein